MLCDIFKSHNFDQFCSSGEPGERSLAGDVTAAEDAAWCLYASALHRIQWEGLAYHMHAKLDFGVYIIHTWKV